MLVKNLFFMLMSCRTEGLRRWGKANNGCEPKVDARRG